MSDTDTIGTEQSAPDNADSGASAAPARKRGGLSGMVLAELRQLAAELNISDTAGMRKGDLIAAIKERQGGAGTRRKAAGSAQGQLSLASDTPVTSQDAAAETRNGAAAAAEPSADKPSVDKPSADKSDGDPGASDSASGGDPGASDSASGGDTPTTRTRRRRTASRPAGAPEAGDGQPEAGGAPAAASQPAEVQASAQAEEKQAERSAEQDSDRSDKPDKGRDQRRDQQDQGGDDSRPRAARDGQNREDSGGGRNRDDSGGGRNRDSNRDDSGGGRNRDNNRDSNRDDSGSGRNRDNNRDSNGGGNNGGGNRDRDNNRDGGANRGNNRDTNNRDNNRDDDDDDGSGRGRRGRRFRDRNRRGRDRRDGGGSGGGGGGNAEPEVRDDDVLLPVAGILDVLDNYAFVRTSGYLSGPNDVYVSLSMVRRFGLRRGDNVSGVVRQPRDGEQQRQKFNPLVRVDTINGLDPEQSKNRPEFTKLTPLYPNERLRLETESTKLTTRVIDLVMPIGKGQRALIVSPPKAGKTMVLQSIANAITTNNPECHLMVVLVDERPEEVTDMQRSVKGEVIASTFDRPPADHTTVAELSIERAKRLVEMGHDVVVLLDSITRLGRAYNLAAPASGRILSGGVDSTALYPPKRFLGAARNIEDGGSLTIFATALVETGSTMDTVIFEEFKGTGNAELKLDRRIADKRVFPAIDVDASGTRKEELLLAPDEMAVTVKLRRVLSALDDQQALDLVLTQLRKTRTNIEFLMQVAKNTPSVEERDR
ncbi:MAG TPA: transcription termination factor Rho [Pseudonocardia sp.]